MHTEEAIDSCFTKNITFAAWHNPNSSTRKIIIEQERNAPSDETFVFHPFQSNKDCSPFYLKNNLEFIEGNDNSSFIEFISTAQVTPKHEGLTPTAKTKEEYLQLIEKAKTQIDQNTFQKVVLSRCIHENKARVFSISKMYSALCVKYPDAFVYVINHPESGTWMGVSPEILLSKEGDLYKTASLAATKALTKSSDPINWTEKEMDEQEIVSQSILSNLQNLGALEIDQNGPVNKTAGNLVHLQSIFSYKFSGEYDKITKLLHPTPAVCGQPKEESLKFILEQEGYNRSYYTGYLGPVNKRSISLFVNLRCMQIFPSKLVLYVGGGITADSNSIEEWKETENKAQTLLSVIRNL